MYPLYFIFPPQWSPFQPPLSVPSLQAWLRRAGYECGSLDANLEFYIWLLSREGIECHLAALDNIVATDGEKCALRVVLESGKWIEEDLAALKRAFRLAPESAERKKLALLRNYTFVRAFETYCAALSRVHDIKLTPYEFYRESFTLTASDIDSFMSSPPHFFDQFCRKLIDRVHKESETFGISCIGQEQLLFTLYLGRLLKERGKRIVVGGTILPRVIDRGRMPSSWFQSYFDLIIRNEGERPLEHLLRELSSGGSCFAKIPSASYVEGASIVHTPPAKALSVDEMPTPDFSDFQVDAYFSGHPTLPILASRGCYWGKCEFCHHGMVYGERYQASEASSVVRQLAELSLKYRVNHFAFNDEAIPPKIFRALGRTLPSSLETNYSFTGMIKFEKFYTQEDFLNGYNIGFRSLYVGLESASERVLALMRKNNKKETMIDNLRCATNAGIWMHCFVFFGFPGETEEEAIETYEFITNNLDIIGTFGCGSFSLEHNAPISKNLAKFGLTLQSEAADSIDVYYPYQVASGINAERAGYWARRLNKAGTRIEKYRATDWIPREHLLGLLSILRLSELIEEGKAIRADRGVPAGMKINELVMIEESGERRDSIGVNRLNLKANQYRGSVAAAMKLLRDTNPWILDIDQTVLSQVVALHDDVDEVPTMYASNKVI